MDIKSLNNKLKQVIKEPENKTKYQEFKKEYLLLLDQDKVSTDTANMAIRAVSIDDGINFLDTFAGLEKKQVSSAWKMIRECEGFKNNIDNDALKLVCSFAASALAGDINTASILGNILTSMIKLMKSQKQETVNEASYGILGSYFLKMLPEKCKFPEWVSIKMTPENILILCPIIEHALDMQTSQETDMKLSLKIEMKRWLSDGKNYAEEQRLLKEEKKNKPAKRSFELAALVKHYEDVEEKLENYINEKVRLKQEVNRLNEKISKLEISIRDKKEKIKELNVRIEELQLKINQANQEVDERKKLNDAQIQYREDVQISLLNDIARALKPEYGDYAETKDIPMNDMLGEIYREKLRKIFKILEQKGIKVED